MKKGSAILWFVSVLLVLLVLTVSIPLTSAWSGSASLSPYTVHQGESTQFTVTVSIDDSRSTDVSWVWVHFGWQSSGVGYYFKADDGTKDSISGYGSKNYISKITVPQSALDQYSVEIQVHAQATGDWWAETRTSTDYVNAILIPTLQVSAKGTPNSGTVPLTVSFNADVSGGLPPYTYSWSFGDGGTSSLANPSHIYTSSGTYTAQVIVRDSSSLQQMVSDSVTVTVQFSVTFTFTKPDGSTLANTTIYYGASKGQETNVLGTTDSSGRITSTNSAFAGQTLYFKSTDGRYTGSTSVSSSGGSTSVSLTEVPGSPTIFLALLVLLVCIGGGIVIMWKKVRSKPKSARHHPIRKRKSPNTRTRLSANKGSRADGGKDAFVALVEIQPAITERR